MVFQFIKRYFGWSLVVVATALVTALVTGNSLTAAVIAIAITLALIAAVVGRGDSLSDSSNHEGSLSEPYSATYRWQVNRQPNFDDICMALDQAGLGLKLESMAPGKLVLRGGSQLHSRLWGGYFVDPKRLPIRAELTARTYPDGARCDVELDIKDNFHMAIRDAALCDRLAQAAEGIRRVVETRLGAMEDLQQT